MEIALFLLTCLLISEFTSYITFGWFLPEDKYADIKRELEGMVEIDCNYDMSMIHVLNSGLGEVWDKEHCSSLKIEYIARLPFWLPAIGFRYYISCDRHSKSYAVPRFSKTEKLIKTFFREGKDGIKNIK